MTQLKRTAVLRFMILCLILAPAAALADDPVIPDREGAETKTGPGTPVPDASCDSATEDCGGGDGIVVPGNDPDECRFEQVPNDPDPADDFTNYVGCLEGEVSEAGYATTTSVDNGVGTIEIEDPSGPMNEICHIESNPKLRFLEVALLQETGVAKIIAFGKTYAATGTDFATGASPSTIQIQLDDAAPIYVPIYGPGNIDVQVSAAINATAEFSSTVATRNIIITRDDGTGIGKISMLVTDTGLQRSGLGIDPYTVDWTDCAPPLAPMGGSGNGGR